VMAYQERISLLFRSGVINELRQRDKINIIEIGGGYGGLAYFIKQILPNANYFICDLPLSLFYPAVYLSLVNHFDDKLIYTAKDKEELFSHRDFRYVPSFLFGDLRFIKFDLAINTLSFAEMESSAVESYIRGLASMLQSSGFLFEQNFDNSRFQLPTFCNPQEIIPKYFKVKMRRESGRWGVAHLWSNHDVRLKACPPKNYEPRPKLFEKDYKGFNLVLYGSKCYALASTLGHVDLPLSDERTLKVYQQCNQCVIGDSVDEARHLIDELPNQILQLKVMPFRPAIRKLIGPTMYRVFRALWRFLKRIGYD
jgi:hypothetical protein